MTPTEGIDAGALSAEGSTRNPVVLVVGVQGSAGQELREALSDRGYLAAETPSVDGARRAFLKEMPELVILDLELAEDQSFRFIRWLRREERSWAPILGWVGTTGAFRAAVTGMQVGASDVVVHEEGIPGLVSRAEEVLSRSMDQRRADKRLQEMNAIYESLPECGGNVSALARTTGIPRSTLYGLLREMGLWQPRGSS